MVRRVTPAQYQAMVRQQQQKQKQAIDRYNREARAHNAKVQRSVDEYNRGARAHNARVRSNRQRLEREIAKLGQRRSTSTRYTITHTSTRSLHQAFTQVEAAADAGMWSERGGGLVDLAEAEAANSAQVLNVLDDDVETENGREELGQTTLTDELTNISTDLDQRWRGALFALNRHNPDAARHFCTSSREVLTQMLDLEAPDREVLEAIPDCRKTDMGQPARHAKITFLLRRGGVDHESLGAFVERDIDDVLGLFGVFNSGTHGPAGALNFAQLSALKSRVEGAIKFVAAVIRS